MPKKIVITNYQMQKLDTIKSYDMKESLIYLLKRLYSYSRKPSFSNADNIADEIVCVRYNIFKSYCSNYNEFIRKRNISITDSLIELDLKKIKTRLSKLEKLGIIQLLGYEINGSNKKTFIYKIIKEGD